jgi:hypothetical protein
MAPSSMLEIEKRLRRDPLWFEGMRPFPSAALPLRKTHGTTGEFVVLGTERKETGPPGSPEKLTASSFTPARRSSHSPQTTGNCSGRLRFALFGAPIKNDPSPVRDQPDPIRSPPRSMCLEECDRTRSSGCNVSSEAGAYPNLGYGCGAVRVAV